MTDKELRKLSRPELLELLITQVKENEQLRAEIAALNEQLQNRMIQIEKTGSIAEASLALNDVFSAAEAAAKQYLENVKWRADNQDAICAQKIAEAEKEAEAILLRAKIQSERKCREAEERWRQISSKMKAFYEEQKNLREVLDVIGEEQKKEI